MFITKILIPPEVAVKPLKQVLHTVMLGTLELALAVQEFGAIVSLTTLFTAPTANIWYQEPSLK